MTRKIVFLVLICILLFIVGLINLSCTNKANGGEDPQTAGAKKYYTKEEVDALLAGYYPKSVVDSLLAKNKSSIITCFGGAGPYETWYCMFESYSREEYGRQLVVPINGVIRNLFAYSQSGGWNPGANAEITVRKNGTDTALVLNYSINDTNSVKSNTSDKVPVSQGDLISIKFRETGGGLAFGTFISFLIDAEE